MKTLEEIAKSLEPEALRVPPVMFMRAIQVAAEHGFDGVLNWLNGLERKHESAFDPVRFVPPPANADPELIYVWSLRCSAGMEALGVLRSSEHYEPSPSPSPWRGDVDEAWFVGPAWHAQRSRILREWAHHFWHAARQSSPRFNPSATAASN